MSMPGGMTRGRSDAVGETVARYPDYEAAQKAVSRLIAADVPARDIAIVGIGLRSVERITGRLGYATAARSGAINGLLLGLLFAAFLVIGSPSVPIQAFVGVLFVGIALGMLMSIIAYSFVRRRRDYASVMQVVADHYDVTVTASGIAKARQVLGGTGAPVAAPVPSPAPQPAPEPEPGPVAPDPTDLPAEPPRYGERAVPSPDAPGEPGEPGDAVASAPAAEAPLDAQPAAADAPADDRPGA